MGEFHDGVDEASTPPGPKESGEIAVQLVYYSGDGPDPSQRTEERPMGDSNAVGFTVKISAEHARGLQETFGRVWGIFIQTKEGDRVTGNLMAMTGTPAPEQIRQEGT